VRAHRLCTDLNIYVIYYVIYALYVWLSYVFIACGCLLCNIRSIELLVSLYLTLDRLM